VKKKKQKKAKKQATNTRHAGEKRRPSVTDTRVLMRTQADEASKFLTLREFTTL